MKKNTIITNYLSRYSSKELERFVDINLDITEQIYAILEKKQWSQKDFAKRLGKTDAEISKWLSGRHNLTLRSLVKMETILEEQIILTPQKAAQKFTKIKYVTLKVHANPNRFVMDNSDYFVEAYNPEMKVVKFEKMQAA